MTRSPRRLPALALAVLLALPGPVGSAPPGTIAGSVRLEGRPVAGVTVAFIELQSGSVVRATSRDDGGFSTSAPAGEYAVTTESQAGLAVGQAPVRVAVSEGRTATADVELVAVASAVLEPPATPAAEPPPGSEPTTTAAPAVEPPAPVAEPPAAPLTTQAPAGAVAPAAPVWAETTGAGAAIQFEPVTCFVAGEFPLLDAAVEPLASVARARVYFKGAQGEAFYYVEMTQEEGRFFGKLPRPRLEASPITYYVQSTTTGFEESQTREIEALVVQDQAECGDRKIAAFGPAGAVTVFSAASGASVIAPAGFAVAASGLAVGAVTVIAGGAAAAGIVGGVVVGPGGGGGGGTGPTPPPIIVDPSPIPTPAPLPTPTVAPITVVK